MRPRFTRGLIAAGSAVLVSGLGIAVANSASAAAGCTVNYSVNQWSSGFTANVTVTNLGDAISTGWKLTWAYAGNQQVTQGWNATITQSGTSVTAASPAYSPNLASNASVTFGFNANYSGTNAAPTTFALNDTACNGSVPTSPTTGTTSEPTTGPTTTPTGNPSAKVDNPFVGAKGYVNPEWAAKVKAVSGGSRIANQPTAVWMDRIAALKGSSDSSSNGSMGLAAHLDEAIKQGAGYIQVVVYNLPGRDCAALASNGELGPDELDRYKTEYIDAIAAIEGDAKYASLRIVNIVEVDSLPNIVTNTGGQAGATAACDTMKANGNYVKGIGYALKTLGAIGNVYNYVDAAHHGWAGWDSNFGPIAEIMLSAAKESGSVDNVAGFITNTANYSALKEPYFQPTTSVGGTSVRQSKWVDWNQYVDELSFAQAFRTKLVSLGFASNIGMLIDTSRNGWGGPKRPTKASTSTSVETFVNESRIDRRIHAGNWCNQAGAGLGERPTAAPATGIDAYVWVKPPGESDGSSSLVPNDEGKGFDRMCDPTYTGNARNGNSMSGALAGAPISGAFFPAQLEELMANAYPPLS